MNAHRSRRYNLIPYNLPSARHPHRLRVTRRQQISIHSFLLHQALHHAATIVLPAPHPHHNSSASRCSILIIQIRILYTALPPLVQSLYALGDDVYRSRVMSF